MLLNFWNNKSDRKFVIGDLIIPIVCALIGAFFTWIGTPAPVYYNGEKVTTKKYESVMEDLKTYKVENSNYREKIDEVENNYKELDKNNSKLLGKIETLKEEIKEYKDAPNVISNDYKVIYNGIPLKFDNKILSIDNNRYYPEDCIKLLVSNNLTCKSDKILLGEVKGKGGEPILLTKLNFFTITTPEIVQSVASANDFMSNSLVDCLVIKESEEDYIEYHLDSKYTNLSGTLAYSNESENTYDIKITFYGDDKELKHFTVTKKSEPIDFNLPVAGVKFLKIVVDVPYESCDSKAILSNMYLHE